MLSYAQFVQQHINDGTWADMGEWQRETIQPSQESAARLMECRMKSYSQLDSINERWEKVLSGMYERYMQPEMEPWFMKRTGRSSALILKMGRASCGWKNWQFIWYICVWHAVWMAWIFSMK